MTRLRRVLLHAGATLCLALPFGYGALHSEVPVPRDVAPEDVVEVKYWSLFRAATENELEARRLAAQCWHESGWRPEARSRAGARGVCQFMPGTWKEWGQGSVTDPEANIRAAARYMRWLTEQTRGNHVKAMAAYNSGLGTLRKAERLQRASGAPGDAWLRVHYPEVIAGAKETQRYVKRVSSTLKDWDGKELVESGVE